jgi:CheY-like chemotaxis protein
MHSPPGRVLLVEDNPNDLELTMLAFEQSRLANRIDVARDGAEALAYLGLTGREQAGDAPVEPPQLILLDVKLPLVDGIDVLQRIKADPRLRHVPVVMLTSSAEDRDMDTCYSLGANSYIVKPVDVDQFFRAIQQVGSYWLILNQPDPHHVPATGPSHG